MPLRPRNSARDKRGALWRQLSLWIYFPLALLLVLGGVCLWKSGRWLVASDRFDKVSWAVVLAGEGRDAERSDAALKLYMDGRIDTLIYSGCRIIKNRYASEFMADYLAKEGYPPEKLFEFRQDAYSTQEEAALLIRQFRQQNLDTVLIITSNFHSARTRRIFRELAQGYPHILVYAADYKDYDPAAWWSSREGRKWWLTEWAKTVSTTFELMNAPVETGKAEVSALINHAKGPVAASEPLLPIRTDSDSLASAALDSATRADSITAARRDTTSQSTAAGDTALPAADSTEKTGKVTPVEKSDRSAVPEASDDRKASRDTSDKDVSPPKDPVPSKVALAARDTAPKKEGRVSTKDSTPSKTTPAKSSATSTKSTKAESSKSESSKSGSTSKSSTKKSSDKSSEKSSSKSSEKDKKKSGR